MSISMLIIDCSFPLVDRDTNRNRFFGKPGTPYDFSGVNLPQVREQCRELEAAHKGMGRKINTKVMNMIDK